jgi:hypothetical protein
VNAILLITGFTQKAKREDGAGLWRLYDRLLERYVEPFAAGGSNLWLQIRTWNYPVAQDAAHLVDGGARRIIVVGYSWGCGKGVLDFCDELERHGRVADLACLIDPVVHSTFGVITNACIPTKRPFPVPSNIDNILAIRTENKPSLFTPFGREVDSPHVRRRVIFASPPEEDYQNEYVRLVSDPAVTHSTIDNSPVVHEECLAAIEGVLAGSEPWSVRPLGCCRGQCRPTKAKG